MPAEIFDEVPEGTSIEPLHEDQCDEGRAPIGMTRRQPCGGGDLELVVVAALHALGPDGRLKPDVPCIEVDARRVLEVEVRAEEVLELRDHPPRGPPLGHREASAPSVSSASAFT